MSSYPTNLISTYSLVVNRILVNDGRNVETLGIFGRVYIIGYYVVVLTEELINDTEVAKTKTRPTSLISSVMTYMSSSF